MFQWEKPSLSFPELDYHIRMSYSPPPLLGTAITSTTEEVTFEELYPEKEEQQSKRQRETGTHKVHSLQIIDTLLKLAASYTAKVAVLRFIKLSSLTRCTVKLLLVLVLE